MRWVVRGGRSSHDVEVERLGNGFTVEFDGQRHELERHPDPLGQGTVGAVAKPGSAVAC